MKYLRIIILVILFITNKSLSIAQSNLKYKIEIDESKGTYKLVNSENGKALFKGCIKIDSLKISSGDVVIDYFIIINQSNFSLFQTNTGITLWEEKIKDANHCYDYTELKEKEKGILLVYSESGRRSVLLNKQAIIYPGDKNLYKNDIIPREDFLNYLVVEGFNEQREYKEGIIDLSGKEILPMQYDKISEYDNKNRLFIVKKDKAYGTVDMANKIIMPMQYSFLTVGDGYYIAKKDDRAGVITPTDTILSFYFSINDGYNHKPYYKNGMFNLEFEYEPIAIDTSYKTLNSIRQYLKSYKSVDYYSKFVKVYENTTFSDEDAKTYYINNETKQITIPHDYFSGTDENPFLFKGGVGLAKDGKWGMLNIETGKVMIPFEYDIPYKENVAGSNLRYKSTAFGVKWITRDRHSIADTTVFLVLKKNGHYGVTDLQGKEMVPFIYESISTSKECKDRNFIRVKKDGLYGLIDEMTFKEKLPCAYEEMMDCKKAKRYRTDANMIEINPDGSIRQ